MSETFHRFEVRLPIDLFNQLTELADRDHRSLNRELIHMATCYVAEQQRDSFGSAFARDWDSVEDAVYDNALGIKP